MHSPAMPHVIKTTGLGSCSERSKCGLTMSGTPISAIFAYLVSTKPSVWHVVCCFLWHSVLSAEVWVGYMQGPEMQYDSTSEEQSGHRWVYMAFLTLGLHQQSTQNSNTSALPSSFDRFVH